MRFASVERLERLTVSEPVYNLSVMEDESYVANGIVTHNCGHVASGYVPALDKNAEQTRAFSNRPFEDDRTKEEVAEYDRQQAVKTTQRERRQIMAQLKAKAAPISKRMQAWADELGTPGTTPERRKELQGLLGEHAERWEQGRRERYKELGTRLKDLKEAK